MVDLIALQIILDLLGYEVRAIVGDDCMQDPISGNDVVFDKLLCSNPLGEVVNSHQDIMVTVGDCRMYCSNDVDLPCRERLW